MRSSNPVLTPCFPKRYIFLQSSYKLAKAIASLGGTNTAERLVGRVGVALRAASLAALDARSGEGFEVACNMVSLDNSLPEYWSQHTLEEVQGGALGAILSLEAVHLRLGLNVHESAGSTSVIVFS